MKQYYEDEYFILPFAHIEGVTVDEHTHTVSIYVSGDEPFTMRDPWQFMKEYKAWLDAENENARN
jgi:hypothetical protein